MGWEKEYKQSVDIIIKNFNKGLQEKDKPSLAKDKFVEI
jgi:hypothetical protein